MAELTISIANWNRADLLRRCLDSVRHSRSAPDFETVVVDNASEDQSVAMLRSEFPSVRVIENAENRGFGAAHNQALAIADSEYFLILNSDAVLAPDTLERLVLFMREHPEATLATCPDRRQTRMTTYHAGGVARYPSLLRTVLENIWCIVRPPLLPDPGMWKLPWRPRHALDLDQVIEVAWVVGALMLARTNALRDVSGFDEGFFLFAEELDLCRRLRERGGRVFFTTCTTFEHLGGGSSDLRSDIESLRGESGARYFRKHHGAVAARAFRVQHLILRRGLLDMRRRAERRVLRWLCRATRCDAL